MTYDPKVNSLIQEISGLCYQVKCSHGINVFFEWSAHFKKVELRGFFGAWQAGRSSDWSLSTYVSDKDSVAALAAMRDRLNAIIAEKPKKATPVKMRLSQMGVSAASIVPETLPDSPYALMRFDMADASAVAEYLGKDIQIVLPKSGVTE
jgi:hypothetical protein